MLLDLGAAPGSWSQYAAEKIGAQGRVLGIDLQQIRITLPNASRYLGSGWSLGRFIADCAGLVPPAAP